MSVDRNTFIREWYNDLVSGKYRQSRFQLGDNGGYCCLGIACLTGQRLGIKEAEWGINRQLETDSYPKGWFSSLIGSAATVGVLLTIPQYKRGRVEEQQYANAASLNDRYQFTFKEIAECIKYTYPDAFTEPTPVTE